MVRYVVGLDALPMIELRSPADGVQCFTARQPLSCRRHQSFMRDESGRLSGSRLNPEIFVAEMRANRNDPVRKMLLGGLVAITPVGGLAERGPATQTRSPRWDLSPQHAIGSA